MHANFFFLEYGCIWTHAAYPYLKEDLEGHELLVAFLEQDGEDAALPHLVQDADAHRGGADCQQHEQQVRGQLLVVVCHCMASWSVLACIHLLSARTLLLAPLQDLVLFTAEWGYCCGSSMKKLELPFSVAWVLEREVNLLRNGGTRH